LVKIKAKFQVKAVGASYHNGFGFQLNLDPSDIKSISGASLDQGITSSDSKGLEIGQSKSTVIVFEDSYDVIDHLGGPYINTDPNQPLSIGEIVEIVIELNSPMNTSEHPENPFIFVDGDRTHEINPSVVMITNKPKLKWVNLTFLFKSNLSFINEMYCIVYYFIQEQISDEIMIFVIKDVRNPYC